MEVSTEFPDVVKLVFRKYLSVLEGKDYPLHYVVKSIEVEFKPDDSLRRLWQLHDVALQEMWDLISEQRSGEIIGLRPKQSLLDLKICIAENIVRSCHFCENRCRVNRFAGQVGKCRCPYRVVVHSAFTHYGEESFVSPSFTIFTLGCNFHCVYCQNWRISQWYDEGTNLDYSYMAYLVDEAFDRGARNLNLYGGEPTPWIHEWLKVIKEIKKPIPILFNSNGYFTPEAQKILEGVVDIMKIDLKYGNDDCARKLSGVENYWDIVTRNTKACVGKFMLLLRHLILPNHVECCSEKILKWLSQEIEPDKYVLNIMTQYQPEYRVLRGEFPELARHVNKDEVEKVVKLAKDLGLSYIVER
ncbi:MAG: radical SAM protein [Thermoprotei archaeon]|nr:MAG: radical SAM protein [Thermoprotei archaeon]